MNQAETTQIGHTIKIQKYRSTKKTSQATYLNVPRSQKYFPQMVVQYDE